MNEMTKSTTGNTLPANIGGLAQSLATSAGMAGSSGNGDLYLKMTKFGEWVFGSAGDEIEEDAVMAVNPLGFQHGFTAWGSKDRGNDGKNVGEVMVPANQPLPAESDLPDVNGTWSKQIGVQMRCTNGEDEGLQFLWKANSLGARKAYTALVNAVVGRIQEGETDIVPLVKLTTDNYTHKTYGKIFTPEFEVVGWAGMDGSEAAPEATAKADTKAEEPSVKEEKSEAEAEEKAPRRRRRRAA